MTAPRARSRALVVTGDDFGFSSGVNRAILEAHTRGILTSASLMVTGAAAAEAVTLAAAHPTLAVGLHLVVVDGQAVLPPAAIPHLVGPDGRFRHGPVRQGLRYQWSPAARRELRAEIRAQLERFRRTGLRLSHVDGHHHLHLHPVVLEILVEAAGEFGVTTIRLPGEELGIALALDRRDLMMTVVGSWVFGALRRSGARRLRPAGIAFPERVYGLSGNGRMTEDYWLRLLPKIQASRVEIYAHPSLVSEGEPLNMPPGVGPAEFAALVSQRVRAALSDHGFVLARPGERLPAC